MNSGGDPTFLTQRRPPAVCQDSWEYRQLCEVGSVLPNALCTADVDDDGLDELMLGTSEGELLVLKQDVREPLCRRSYEGTISVVVINQSKTLVTVCLEGLCAISEKFSPQTDTTILKSIPSNCVCGALSETHIFLGSSDRRIFLFHLQSTTIVASLFTGAPVCSLIGFTLSNHNFIGIASSSCLWVVRTDPDTLAFHHGVNEPIEESACWKQEMAQLSQNPNYNPNSTFVAVSCVVLDDLANVAVATADGCLCLYRFANCRSLTTKPPSTFIVGADENELEVVVQLMWSIHVGSLLPHVSVTCLTTQFQTPLVAVVAITTAGTTYVCDTRKNAIVTELTSDICAFSVKTCAKGQVTLLCASLDEIVEYVIPCRNISIPSRLGDRSVMPSPSLHLGMSPCFGSTTPENHTELFDPDALLHIGRALFPGTHSSAEVLQRKVVELCCYGYSPGEWERLRQKLQTHEDVVEMIT